MMINYQGKQIEVTEVEVVTANEPWSEYRLQDGKILSVKNVLISVYKAVNEKSPDGESLYVTKNQNIVKVK
jgi:hypothetical protein